MKNILYILLLTILCSSCEKYLDTKPTDFTSPDLYYDTETQLNEALAGVYNSLAQDGTYARNIPVELAISDEGFYKRSTDKVDPIVYNYTAAHGIILASWRELYRGVNRANLLLANINKPTMDETKRNAIKGEAMFLRAYFYFQLVSTWGNVPLLLHPTVDGEQVNLPRTSSKEIFEYILKDMTEAQKLVKPSTDVGFGGRVSKTVVQGILARVCLKMAGEPLKDISKYSLAKDWADSVIRSNEHSLNPDYKQVFINHSADKYDVKESMWEVEFWGNQIGNPYKATGRIGNQFSIRSTTAEMYGYANIGATAVLYRLYDDPNDVRRDWNIAPFKYVSNSSLVQVDHNPTEIYDRDTGKWRREYEVVLPRNVDFSPTNFPLLRYADVLLMYAEAENGLYGATADAYEKLNEVRRRAKAYEYTIDNSIDPITKKSDFLKIIIAERSRELCFEGLRKFDLIRWGIFKDAMEDVAIDINANAPATLKYPATAYQRVNDKHVLQPIPSLELSLNKSMYQNKGW